MTTFSTEVKRWLGTIHAAYKVCLPVLRDFIAQEMPNVYAKYDQICVLKTLTCTEVAANPKLFKSLKFHNINNNDGKKKTDPSYSYNINTLVDFTKLFLPDYLAKSFCAFDETLDLSATLRLLGDTPIFISPDPTNPIQAAANDVKDKVRNKFSHFNSCEWTEHFFDDCFSKMEVLVRSLGLSDGGKATLDELADWKAKAPHLNTIDPNLFSLVPKDLEQQLREQQKATQEAVDSLKKRCSSLEDQQHKHNSAKLQQDKRLKKVEKRQCDQENKVQVLEKEVKEMSSSRRSLSCFSASSSCSGSCQDQSEKDHTSNPTSKSSGISVDGSSQEKPLYEGMHLMTEMDPDQCPIEGGPPFNLISEGDIPEELTSAKALIGSNWVKVNKTDDRTFTGIRLPRGEKPGYVDVLVYTSDENYLLGKMKLLYLDDDIRRRMLQLVIHDEEWKKAMFLELAEKACRKGSSTQKSSNVEPSGHGKSSDPVDVLESLVHMAAELDGYEFLNKLFSSSAKWVVFSATKDKAPLPEDTAKTNGHAKTADFLRGIYHRFSEEEKRGQKQPSEIDWAEVLRVFEITQEQPSVSKDEVEKKFEINTLSDCVEDSEAYLQQWLNSQDDHLNTVDKAPVERVPTLDESVHPNVYLPPPCDLADLLHSAPPSVETNVKQRQESPIKRQPPAAVVNIQRELEQTPVKLTLAVASSLEKSTEPQELLSKPYSRKVKETDNIPKIDRESVLKTKPDGHEPSQVGENENTDSGLPCQVGESDTIPSSGGNDHDVFDYTDLGKTIVDNKEGVIKAISIGLVIVNFLLTTSRVLEAIEICKNFLILLENKALEKQKKIVRSLYVCVLNTILTAYDLINDYTSGTDCARKLQVFLHGYGERAEEGEVTIGVKVEKGTSYGNLGAFFQSVGKYAKAEEYFQKALEINKEIGDREGEATSYGNLGTVFQSVGQYIKAEEYLHKALAIRKEIGDRQGEATSYENLGTVFQSLGQYVKAKEYLQKALEVNKEIGDIEGEATSHGNLGPVFQSVGQYVKTGEYLHKAFAIRKEIGDRQGKATSYGNLGTGFFFVGQYGNRQKTLAITKEIGDKQGEASSSSLGEYFENDELYVKSPTMCKDVTDREEKASFHVHQGSVCYSRGEYSKAKAYYEKALAISKKNGDRHGEASDYGNLGTFFLFTGDYVKAKEYHVKALEVSKEIGDIKAEMTWHNYFMCDLLTETNVHEALTNLFASIQKSDERFQVRDDQFKIFFDKHVLPYQLLSALFCSNGNPYGALYVVELGRARALADIMSAQYSVEKQVSVDLQSWDNTEGVMKKESNCTCLYISYHVQHIFLWILKAYKPVVFRRINVNECLFDKGLGRKVDDVFANKTLIKSHGQCKDQSLLLPNTSDLSCESSQQENIASLRVKEDEKGENPLPKATLVECYKTLIAPVAEFLDEPELIIVPDCSLFTIPFAALKDENEGYLSDTFRIRIVPSLSTLKLIQDCPADYHSRTGALIVGDPEVGLVHYKGKSNTMWPLPNARREAEMIGQLLGIQPLVGRQATKQAVLQSISSVSLIHIAAHGCPERGEIALAPQHPIYRVPQEDDYLLTMTDISQVRLRAKLVVLSCCHSARGQIRAEGVVGIARAFLGSGARSVLLALWAVEDRVTREFLSHFYEYLVHGESASESLYEAMKWMRSNGYSDVRDWAPFMLFGDNVTFDFGK